jgi:hypothetical protein
MPASYALPRRPEDHPPRQRIVADEVDVGATRRDGDRLLEAPPEQRRGDAVRVEVVRIDEVEIVALGEHPLERPDHRPVHQQGRQVHPDLRDERIARVRDGDAVPRLLGGDAGIAAIGAEAVAGDREPRHRGDDPRGDLARAEELAEAILDEDAVARLLAVREQRREGQDLHHAARSCGDADPASPERRAASQSPAKSAS